MYILFQSVKKSWNSQSKNRYNERYIVSYMDVTFMLFVYTYRPILINTTQLLYPNYAAMVCVYSKERSVRIFIMFARHVMPSSHNTNEK